MPHIWNKPGDVNLDGSVDVLDTQLVVNVFLGSEGDPGIVKRSDLTKDGHVDTRDVDYVNQQFLHG